MPRKPYPFQYAARYRTVAEALVLDQLALAGWAFEMAAGGSSSVMGACADTLDALRRCGVGWETAPDGTRLYDPVEVANALKETGLSGRTDFLRRRAMVTGRALVASWMSAGAGQLRDIAPPRLADGAARRFLISWTRRFGATFIASGAVARLRLPVPAPDDPDVTAHVLKVATAISPAALTVQPGRIELRWEPGETGDVEVMAELDVTSLSRVPEGSAHDRVPRLTVLERELYLRRADGLVCVTPKVRDAALALCRGRKGEDALRTFWLHLMATMTCGRLHYDQLSPSPVVDWVLDHGWFDCQIGSALLAAMCRAIGIPARLIAGHVLYPLAPTNHYWMEAWFDGRGWVPFDLLGWDLSAGGEDELWRDVFFGRLDGRLVTHRFPRQVPGPPGVTMPASWYLLQRRVREHLVVSLCALDGRVVLDDRIAVTPAA